MVQIYVLKSIISVTTIGVNTFYQCTALTSVNLPKVTSIGTYAFNGCIGLTSLTFGSVVENIGTSPFYGASTTGCTLILNEAQTGVSGNTWAGANGAKSNTPSNSHKP